MAGFNKMFIMLPIMFAARKIDGEDPKMIFLLRCSYFSVQAIILMIVAYIYFKSQAVAGDKQHDRTIYVAPAASPFADPNAKKQYKEVNYAAHVATTAKSLVTSTLFGIAMTTGLHLYKGMVVGLAIQSIMGPFTIYENPLVQALLLGKGLNPEAKVFDEKGPEELTADDEIVDEQGNPISAAAKKQAIKGDSKKTATTTTTATPTFEDILLDTWDGGADASVGPLMAALNKKTVNYKSKESGWTPIMVVSGLGAKKVTGALRQMKAIGADPAMLDEEGWNALHWAAFHGSPEAAKVLVSPDDFDAIQMGLHKVKDKEGKTPMDHAIAEGNTEVANIIKAAIDIASSESTVKQNQEPKKQK